MDVFEAIENRRSVRSYTSDAVSAKEIKALIDAARQAPSAGNIQPWEFIIVTDPETKEKLSAAALDQKFIEAAPVVIVVCADENRSSQRYGSRGANLYCLQDTAAAVQNMLLAACGMGLGACWIGAFNEEMARRIMKTPNDVRPVAIVPVGHPAGTPRAPPKRPIGKIVHYESF
ncbi:MAG: nitroreductase family protein [Candidatus Bathyarchaeota archaeon]|nr:MAG: nitroreductase family protein [Candidatus Bathyarchaeota archaeon]